MAQYSKLDSLSELLHTELQKVKKYISSDLLSKAETEFVDVAKELQDLRRDIRKLKEEYKKLEERDHDHDRKREKGSCNEQLWENRKELMKDNTDLKQLQDQYQKDIRERDRKLEKFGILWTESETKWTNQKEECKQLSYQILQQQQELDKLKSLGYGKNYSVESNQDPQTLNASVQEKEKVICCLQEKCQLLSASEHALQQNIQQEHKEKLMIQKELDKLRLRFSLVAQEKLTRDNSAVADLSDDNRPTKLAEKFNELYDNEWTNAFEEIEKALNIRQQKGKDSEEIIIEYLLKILWISNKFCCDLTENQIKEVKKVIMIPEIVQMVERGHQEADPTSNEED